jgi:predicted O-methyltransferase YrrM
LPLHQLLSSYWLSMTLITAIRLGVFERLSAGPAPAAAVARDLRLHPDGVERLLTALASVGLLHAVPGGQFTNSPLASALLVSSSPDYVGGIAHHHARHLWPVWTHLETAVREGRNVLPEAFGAAGDPFTALLASPESARQWMEGMHAGAAGLGEAIAAAHDFRGHRHVIDAGGGAGTVAIALARAYPHLRVTVMERAELCRLLPGWMQERQTPPGVTVREGDLFQSGSFPPDADAVLLVRVLHDWSDPGATAILRSCRDALPAGGLVIVAETLLEPEGAPQPFSALSNLMMLALTDGGRERSGAAYERLLREAGLLPAGTTRLQGLGIVRGRKPGPS